MKIEFDARAFGASLKSAMTSELERVDRAVLEGLKEATEGLKEEMRDRTFQVLGRKVAYAWQARHYPNRGDPRGPAGFVWSKAPRIIDFNRAERIVTPIGGAFAIAVNPVIKRGGRPMTIAEVESKFNQDLEPRRLPSGNIGLFADLVRGSSSRRPGFRQATKGRLGAGRKVEKVLMFVLVRQLRSRKRIDLVGPANRWGARIPELIEKRLGASGR